MFKVHRPFNSVWLSPLRTKKENFCIQVKNKKKELHATGSSRAFSQRLTQFSRGGNSLALQSGNNCTQIGFAVNIRIVDSETTSFDVQQMVFERAA